MCGIYAGFYDRPVDKRGTYHDLLWEAASAARRGPHGYGWVTDQGSCHRLGKFVPENLPNRPYTWVVGHSRLATLSNHDDARALQPAICGGHVLAHNGSVANWLDLHIHGVVRQPSDSHLLAHLYATYRDRGWPPVLALETVLASAEQRQFALLIRDSTGLVMAARDGLPLFVVDRPGETVLSSVGFDGADQIPSGSVVTLEARIPA
jgi:glutamine phosphoribosylpyrophosphate amidotransferase